MQTKKMSQDSSTSVGECKELNLKHSQMKIMLGIVVLPENFGTKMKVVNVV
jgi:hypothetical protein